MRYKKEAHFFQILNKEEKNKFTDHGAAKTAILEISRAAITKIQSEIVIGFEQRFATYMRLIFDQSNNLF